MLFNTLFFAVIFRLLGNGGIIHWKGKPWAALPRWSLVLLTIVILALNAMEYPQPDDLYHLIAWIWIFVTVRLLSTRPLLDIMQDKPDSVKRCLIRSLWVIPSLLYIGGLSWLLVLQSPIYWLCGRFRRKDSLLPECVTGFIFGMCI